MRLLAGDIAVPLPSGYNNLISLVRQLVKVVSEDTKIFIVLKPCVVTARIKGFKRNLVVGPGTLIVRNYNEYLDIPGSFKLVEDSWGDLKIFNPMVVIEGSEGELLDMIKEMGLKRVSKCMSCCRIYGQDVVIDLNEYDNKILPSSNHLVILSEIQGSKLIKMDGNIRYFFRDHPVIHGLEMQEKFISVDVADITNLRKLNVLGKPLLFIDDYPILLEIPYNRSLIFTAKHEDLKELMLKAIIYVC